MSCCQKTKTTQDASAATSCFDKTVTCKLTRALIGFAIITGIVVAIIGFLMFFDCLQISFPGLGTISTTHGLYTAFSGLGVSGMLGLVVGADYALDIPRNSTKPKKEAMELQEVRINTQGEAGTDNDGHVMIESDNSSG